MRSIRLLQRLHEPLIDPRRALAVAALTGVVVATLAGGVAAPPASAARVDAGPRSTVRLAAPGDSLESPGETDRVSLETNGSQLRTASGSAAVSANGRYVVYRTAFLAGGIDVGRIMLRDRVAGTTTQVARGSVASGIAFIVTAVSEPAISGNGRWVAFTSGNPNAAAASRTVRLWDRTTGQLSSPLDLPKGWADEPALSGDGRYLAFRTTAVLDPADTNGFADVYVLDRQSGSYDRVSSATGSGGGFRGDSGEPAISANGRFVAFSSSAIRLISQSVPIGQSQIYLRDRAGSTTVLVSAGPGGQPGSLSSTRPTISDSGAVVAFSSLAPDLVSGDINRAADIFTWDAASRAVRLASVSTEGGHANGSSSDPSLSGDGRLVAFASDATNLVPGDTNGVAGQGLSDVFLHDLTGGRTTRISVGPGPSQANGSSGAPATNSDGGVVAFESSATNLVRGDTNGVADVFVRLRSAGLSIAPDPTDFGVAGAGASPPAPRTITISSTGIVAVTIHSVSIAGPGAGSFAVISDGCSGRQLAPGASCQVAVAISIGAAGQVTADLSVDDTAPGSPHTAVLTGLVLPSNQAGAPKIVLSPVVGPTGTVVSVTGSGFVAGQPVALTWSTGITPTPLSPIQAAPDGTLKTEILVLPNDLLGPRTLSAASVVGGTPGSPATADFLVVPRTAQPPSSALVRIAIRGMGRSLIFRR